MARLLRKLGWFSVVGIFAALLYGTAVFVCVEWLGLNPLAAHGIGLALAALCSYIGHYSFTFQAKGRHKIYVPRFIVQAIVSVVLSTAAMMLVTRIQLSYLFAVMATMVLIPGVNFLLMQFWVFKAGHEQK